jgi:NADPH:quinone reductase-like Zn-dependent oxidoreductase
LGGDRVAATPPARSWPVLRSGGILVAIAEEPDPSHGGRSDVRGVFFVVEPNAGQLRQLARLIDDQQLRPMVSRVFELNDLAEAFRALHGERPPGKVVISVSA